MALSCPCFSSFLFWFHDLPSFLSVTLPDPLLFDCSLLYTYSVTFPPLSSPSTTVFFFSLLLFPYLTIPFHHYSLTSLYSPYDFTPQLSPTTLSPLFSITASSCLPLSDVRLRVRAEYLEHDTALREGVSSDKEQPLERQFELFSQANSLLRARDLGSIVCEIKFTELDNLEAFWSDYLSGALLEALKGVFITDSLRMAAGTEGVRLLISVDQDDYEQGRMLLRVKRRLSTSNGGRTETHFAV